MRFRSEVVRLEFWMSMLLGQLSPALTMVITAASMKMRPPLFMGLFQITASLTATSEQHSIWLKC